MNSPFSFKCINGHEIIEDIFHGSNIIYECPECEELIYIDNSFSVNPAPFFKIKHSFWEYIKEIIPEGLIQKIVTINEGNTPLFQSRKKELLEWNNVYFKDETQNPTKSYRDRAASVLVSHAASIGFKTIFSASMGNMGASISAYAASAGLVSRIFSEKEIDIGKKAQILTFGGILSDDFQDIDAAMENCLNTQIEEGGYQATAELNPLALLAQKTISYEIYADEIIPDEIYVSIGNGGTLFSIWQGFNDLKEWGLISEVPKMMGASMMAGPDSKVSTLKKSGKYSQRKLMDIAIKESRGSVIEMADEEIGTAISTLARAEALFAEPAAAAAYAALLRQQCDENYENDKIRVVIITGSGLKAPSVINALTRNEPYPSERTFQNKLNLRVQILEKLSQIGDDGLHGYGIYALVKNEMKCSKQAIYLHLKQLEEKMFIQNAGKDEQGRKIFRITPNGKEVLDLLKKLVLLL